ncbi:hypothetical protein ACFL20_06710, partial [Spirochaetota bacterium]
NPYLYSFAIIFTVAALILNYKFNFFYSLRYNRLKSISIFYYFIFYAIPYFTISFAQIFLQKKYDRLSDYQFWLRSIVFIFLIAFGSSAYFNNVIKLFSFARNEYRYMWRIFTEVKKSIVCLIPLIIFKRFNDRSMNNLYGLTFKNFDFKPYLLLLLIVLPLIIGASFNSEFLNTYPVFKSWKFSTAFSLTKTRMSVIFETIYLLDFVIVEMLFRGALIIGMISIIGKDSVLPMTVTYVFLHFGKPLGEAISSAFGGYILGIIALNTLSIMGGCFLHIGVAFLMNICAHIQYLFKFK